MSSVNITTNSSAIPYNLLIYFWFIGTLIASGRVGLGMLYNLKTYRQSSTAANHGIQKRIEKLLFKASRRIGLHRKVTIIMSDRITIPQTYGIIKPVIILPSQAASWSEQRLLTVLLHELAHIKRNDHIVWPLANIAVSWLWFNPLVWLALSRMRRESEKACDDYVLRSGTPGISYAEHLYVLCRTFRSSMKLASVTPMLVRKSELEERITYMLNKKTARFPMSLKKGLVIVALIASITIPLVGVSGFSVETTLSNVNPGDRDAIMSTLSEFYYELSQGSDYQSLRDRFLTSDYFDSPELTLENLDLAVRRIAFDNTLYLLSESGIGVAKEVHQQVTSIEREGEEYIVTLILNVVADRFVGESKLREYDGAVVWHSIEMGEKASCEECRLVNSLKHKISLRIEEGFFKISHYDDGFALMRMDTNNPYGPIFLFWMEDINSQVTPYGPGIFKVIPVDIVPSAHNTKFVLEN
jgi:beta-lactamase regulating signal transducer with metallopeptidase domain